MVARDATPPTLLLLFPLRLHLSCLSVFILSLSLYILYIFLSLSFSFFFSLGSLASLVAPLVALFLSLLSFDRWRELRKSSGFFAEPESGVPAVK